MSHLSPALWMYHFPAIPMPENCTYQDFAMLRDAMWREERLTESAGYIKKLRALKKTSHNPAYDQLINQEIERIAKL